MTPRAGEGGGGPDPRTGGATPAGSGSRPPRQASGAFLPGGSDVESGAGARLEEELRRLEIIVQRLEREDVPLDEALALFEEGIAIARSARSKLEAAEGRIREILREAGDAFRVRELEP
ncbi:MAG TPA: exodeoxyribonuclease VII small subunit [Gemmatimonadota bacterium]|jgi:exodeoxyribonuclease VII small subunit